MEFFYEFFQTGAALLLSLASLAVYRHLPAAWLCDYGEAPDERHRAEWRCVTWRKAVPLMWCGCLVMYRAAGRMEPAGGLVLSAAFLILMPAVLSDCDYRIIPDQSAGAMLFLGAVICAARPEASIRNFAGGGALALCLMLLSAVLGRLAAGQAGIGTGDVKLMTACGACIGASHAGGWVSAVLVFYTISILSGACWFCALLLLRKAHYGDMRPMAPWIAASALLCLAAAP